MPNLQDIRRRIGSVKSTQKITRAMKMVAAAKLRRAQDAVVRARPYAHHLAEVTNQVLVHADPNEHPLLHPHDLPRIAIIVVTSDRGLCGGFNGQVVSETMRLIREDFAGKQVELTIIGRKGTDALRRRPCTIHATYTGLFEKFSAAAPQRVIDEAVERYLKRRDWRGLLSVQRVQVRRGAEDQPGKTAAVRAARGRLSGRRGL